MAAAARLRGSLDANVRSMAFPSKIVLDISLDGQGASDLKYLHSYSTMDKIEGSVTLRPKNDTPFDELEIMFIGKS